MIKVLDNVEKERVCHSLRQEMYNWVISQGITTTVEEAKEWLKHNGFLLTKLAKPKDYDSLKRLESAICELVDRNFQNV